MEITAKTTIYNHDSRFLNEIEDCSVDFVITSPPFNIGHKYMSYHDSLDGEGFDSLYTTVIRSISRVLKDDGVFIIDIADLIVMEKEIVYGAEFVKEKALLSNLVFICSIPYIAIEGYDKKMKSRLSRDNCKSKFHSSCEQILVFGKQCTNFDLENSIALKSSYTYSMDRDSAFWPEDLILDVLKPFDLKGKLLLDPFMGSGTIGRISIEKGACFVGYDVDKMTLKKYGWI